MRIGHLLFGSNREFDYGHVKQDLKIGETKSISYPIVMVLNCMMSCRIIPYVFAMIFRLGSDGKFLTHFCS